MLTTSDVYKVQLQVQNYEHLTKMTFFSTKLEWRIEHFDKIMRFCEEDQTISSKTFTLPHFQAVFRLDVYPHGYTYTNKQYTHKREYVYGQYFFLRLIGFQMPDGSLSKDETKSIKANCKMYFLSGTNEERVLVPQQLTELKIDKDIRNYNNVSNQEIKEFTHSDGSLLVICEIECKGSEETFSLEPPLNIDLLDQNQQLTDHIGKMWKSQLFTDCTLKVGAKSFPAHKCILGQWSEVFRNMFSLPLEEAKSGIVEIEDCSPDAISAMLEYMYTGVVEKKVMKKLAPDILALADIYGVIPLKEMCEVFLASKLTTTNFLQTVFLADRYSAPKLKRACVNRLAIDGRAALQSKEWDDLKNENKDLADELLELLIKDHPWFADVKEAKVAK